MQPNRSTAAVAAKNTLLKIAIMGLVGLVAMVAGFLLSPAHAAVVLFSTDTVLDTPITSAPNLLDPTATTGTVRVDNA